MTILTANKQLLYKQYGLGIKYQRDIRGGNIFQTIKRYGLPVAKFLFHKILKPFWKNNKDDIIRGAVQSVKNLVQKHEQTPKMTDVKEEILQPIFQKIKEKSLADHLRGEGLNKKSKKILKKCLEED